MIPLNKLNKQRVRVALFSPARAGVFNEAPSPFFKVTSSYYCMKYYCQKFYTQDRQYRQPWKGSDVDD
jgi:hypothetical protein